MHLNKSSWKSSITLQNSVGGMKIIREACVGSFKESQSAVLKGADRLELCENLAEGGTTPSYGTIALAGEKLDTPLLVMIRPRGGDFVYSPEEIEIMKHDIQRCKELGVYGVVFGVLTPERTLNMQAMKTLVELSKPMQITCHMAFDALVDPFEGLEQLVELGVDRILTRGGDKSAYEGRAMLKDLVSKASNRIVIVAGGGVTEDNYQIIVDETGVKEVHGTKIVGKL